MVDKGDATGLGHVLQESPADGLQMYEATEPLLLLFSVVLLPSTIVALLNAFTMGDGITVKVKLAAEVQFPIETLAVYTVVATGLTETDGLFCPFPHR